MTKEVKDLYAKSYKMLKTETEGFPDGSKSKESACNVGDPGSIPGSGRSLVEGNGNPLQYSYWKIPWTEEPGLVQLSWTQLSK